MTEVFIRDATVAADEPTPGEGDWTFPDRATPAAQSSYFDTDGGFHGASATTFPAFYTPPAYVTFP